MAVNDPTIPFGWKRITGQLQKGDAIWDGERFRKVKKEYPNSEGRPGFLFAIRRCTVTQTEIPECAEHTITLTDGNGGNPTKLNREQYEALKKSGMLWEFHPDAPLDWPECAGALPLDE